MVPNWVLGPTHRDYGKSADAPSGRLGRRYGPRLLPRGSWSARFDRCRDCGTTEIPYGANGRCRKCYYLHRRGPVVRTPRMMRACAQCGLATIPAISNVRYCGRECRRLAALARRVQRVVVCAQCGTSFQAPAKGRQYCGHRCSNLARGEALVREGHVVHPLTSPATLAERTRACEHCRRSFVAPSVASTQRFCNQACSTLATGMKLRARRQEVSA